MKYLKALLLSTFIFPCISQAAVVDLSYPLQAAYSDGEGIKPTIIIHSASSEQTIEFFTNLVGTQVEIQGIDSSENFLTVLNSTETENSQHFSQLSSATLGVSLDTFIILDSSHVIEAALSNSDANWIIHAANDGINYGHTIDINSSASTTWSLAESNVPEPSIMILLSLGFASIAIRFLGKSSN